jgi:hypothetical protein
MRTIKIELHTTDGQVFHAAVTNHPQIGELVVSEQGSQFMIDDQGHEYQNYPYRMYKAKPLASTESPPRCTSLVLDQCNSE